MDITVRVTPKAGKNMLEYKGGQFCLKVSAPPVDGEANKAVIKFLAGMAGIAKSCAVLVRGETSRIKTVRLSGVNEDKWNATLELIKSGRAYED